ncbi:MAG: hypothetical protein G01um101466_248 [Parcubacteria group bacterium Gr01-1014_66]|nr:MAG: hypothetical protein G01um101466_248 [Parcubacteria group bacterium Gr01-1014_66]
MNMVKKITIEQLAGMVQKGFLEMKGEMKGEMKSLSGKVESLEQKVDNLEQKMEVEFAHVNARLDRIAEDISDLPEIREELHKHDRRITRVERKVGIK